MKRIILLFTALLLAGSFTELQAQFMGASMSGSAGGPSFSGDLLKLFGEHKAFSANVEFQIRMTSGDKPATLPGVIAFSSGKTRFELDLTQVKGAEIPPQTLDQLKQVGMDKLVTISLPDSQITYLIYPGLKAYVEQPLKDPDAGKPASDYTVTVTKQGEEKVEGRDCIKNKVVVTDKDGKSHESTVWNAVDLKEFPVKIQTTQEGHDVVMLFTDVKLSLPAPNKFSPPAGYEKYDNIMAMMQQVMMKRMGRGGTPPAK